MSRSEQPLEKRISGPEQKTRDDAPVRDKGAVRGKGVGFRVGSWEGQGARPTGVLGWRS